MNIVYWEEVVFELVGKLEGWLSIILIHSLLVKLNRANNVSCCHDGELSTSRTLRFKPDDIY